MIKPYLQGFEIIFTLRDKKNHKNTWNPERLHKFMMMAEDNDEMCQCSSAPQGAVTLFMRSKYFGTRSQRLFVITVTSHVCPCGPYHQIHFKMNRSEVLSRISRQQHPTHFCINYLWVHLKPLKHNGVPSWTPSRKQMLWPVCTCLYFAHGNIRHLYIHHHHVCCIFLQRTEGTSNTVTTK